MAAPYEERAEEVTFLLEQCGLARYAPAFRNDDVDDSFFARTMTMLEELGRVVRRFCSR